MKKLTLFRGPILNPETERRFQFIRDGALAVESTGRILGFGEYRDLHQSYHPDSLIDLSDNLMVPGFVDTHVHLPQLGAAGLYGEELLEWLTKYIYPSERGFTPEVAERVCPFFFSSLLNHGITTAAIYCSIQKDSTLVAFDWAQRSGIRAIMGKVMMDQNAPDFLMETTAESLRSSADICKIWHGQDQGRLLYAFIPRFAITCTRDLMEGAGHLAIQYQARIQTHIAENLEEVKQVQALFPEARNYADVYFKAGLLGPHSVLAHGIYLNQDERILLQATRSGLSHCPISNLFLRSGLMPLRDLMNDGLRIGLGSDVGGGPTLSPFEVMRSAIYVDTARKLTALPGQGHVTPATAFYLATLGGAQALGLEDSTGSFSVGKEADIVVIDREKLSPWEDPKVANIEPETLLSRLIFCGDDRVVERTYVRGRLCFDKHGEAAKD